jgi:hypothetical protein
MPSAASSPVISRVSNAFFLLPVIRHESGMLFFYLYQTTRRGKKCKTSSRCAEVANFAEYGAI